jgi:hypothetical protein
VFPKLAISVQIGIYFLPGYGTACYFMELLLPSFVRGNIFGFSEQLHRLENLKSLKMCAV